MIKRNLITGAKLTKQQYKTKPKGTIKVKYVED